MSTSSWSSGIIGSSLEIPECPETRVQQKSGDLPWRKDFSQSISNLGVEAGREDHVELQDHSSLLEWVSVLWHPLSLNLLQVAGLDDFPYDSISLVLN